MMIQDDIFLLQDDEANYIVYAPLRGVAAEVNEQAATLVRQFLNGQIKPEDNKELLGFVESIAKLPTLEISTPRIRINERAVIILSQRCNLACTYCFAHDAHSDKIMKWDTLRTIIDYIISNEGKKKEFAFIGGGEPLFEWDLLCKAITYIRANQGDVQTLIHITTNATLLNEERILWLKQYDVKVSISCDVLPRIQDQQRPFPRNIGSFKMVDHSIRLLLKHGFTFRLRATITELNVELMPEMVQFVIDNYPEIKKLHFEQVSGEGITYDNYYSKFISSYFKAKRLAMLNGIMLRSSVTNSVKRLHTRFCNGELCFTPEGNIVACHRVSTIDDKLFHQMSYGKVTNEGVLIAEKEKSKIESADVNAISRCRGCFAKYTCAGGCRFNQLTFSERQMDDECRFIKEMQAKEMFFLCRNNGDIEKCLENTKK